MTEKVESGERAISYDDVMDVIHHYYGSYGELVDAIKEVSSVTPAPKMGRWKKFDVGYGCSECSLCTNKRGIDFYRYCPNCGAKMETQEESESCKGCPNICVMYDPNMKGCKDKIGRGGRMTNYKELEEKEKQAKEYQKAINRASSLIDDARARYIKEKTRARSKKAALEKDAALKSPRFDVLKDYDRFEDIQEAYGCDCFGEAERDRLEDLWEEREEIMNHTDNGVYSDLVTKALHEAWVYIQDLWIDEIDAAAVMRHDWEKEKAQAEEEYKRVERERNEAYERLVKGVDA